MFAIGQSVTISSSVAPNKPSEVCLRYCNRLVAAMVPNKLSETLFSCQKSMDVPIGESDSY